MKTLFTKKHVSKKIWIIIFFLGVNSLAQSNVDFGIKAGVNFTGFHTNGNALTSNIGFHIGGTTQIKLEDSFHFLGELLYNRKGGTQNTTIGSINTTLDYIDIPILMRYYFIKKLSLDAGPQIGFLLHSNSELIVSDTSEEIKLDATNVIDFAVNVGFTFDFNEKYSAQLRGSYGVTTIFEQQEYKNYVISLSLLYKL